jgi:hypothetical protein
MSSPRVSEGNLRPTSILDHEHQHVRALVRRVKTSSPASRAYLQAGYQVLREAVCPVYTVDELQPTSVTLAKGRGSCSQRFACLESMARAAGIGTRVRGLWVAGRFWNRRFRVAMPFIPLRVLLAWPQFHLDGAWVSVEELFESPASLAERNPRGFANDGETLFDAIDHVAVDFGGKTAACASGACDLSGFVVGDAGVFESRDELFAAHSLFQHTLRGRAFEWLYGGRRSA